MAKKVKANGYSVKAGVGTLAIVLISVMLMLSVDRIFSFRGHESMLDMGAMFMIGNLLSFAMFVLSIYLTFTYLKDYLELKSSFTLGIILAVVSFMMFALTSMPAFHMLLGVYGRPGPFNFVPYLFATISLGILAWLSSK
ncbi:MAG: hypothetical protein ACP5NX_00215 [Candidatus Bilamarchaeaceae archaeon]